MIQSTLAKDIIDFRTTFVAKEKQKNMILKSSVALILRSSVSLNKVAKYIVQGPVPLINTKMGSMFSRSFTPSCPTTSDNCTTGTIQTINEDDQYVESVVCGEHDLKENEMKVFDVGQDGRVLLIKQKGEFNAIGPKCSHYGAPLVNGALGDGRVRCPWHGACFNIKTGDIEDFPGFDSLPCYQVSITPKGEVKVRAKLSELKSSKRIKNLGILSPCDCNSVVIIGGGPSGATCAETLRSEGFKGSITMVCKEKYLPYDRIKVSKIGTVTDIEKLQARSPEYYERSNITILKGVEATKVDTYEKKVHLSNGETLSYGSLYVATGSKPRRPAIPGSTLNNIFTVRDFQDSIDILTAIGKDKDKNVVVLGLGFIGLEIAASCVASAKSLTVVGKDSVPQEQAFGKEIGGSIQRLCESKGIKFQLQTTIKQCNGQDGQLSSVELENGTTLPADVLILGIGTTFYTDFLKDSGFTLEANGSIAVNNKLETSVDNVYAGGDIAYAPVAAYGNMQLCIGHVGLAQYHGRVAALNILKKDAPLTTVPYFWTVLFGKSIRYTGCGRAASTQIEGDVNELKFVIFFFDTSDKVIAVASCMRDPVVSQFAEYLHQGKALYKDDLKPDPFAWTKNIN